MALKKQIITTIQVSSDQLNIKEYAHIISKDTDKMIDEVRTIFKSNFNLKAPMLGTIQKNRIKELEKIFDDNENKV